MSDLNDDMRQWGAKIRAAAGLPAVAPMRIIVTHKKTGGLYEVMGPATLEASGEAVTVYRSMADGRVWVRPTAEMLDGRFELHAGGAA
jgi:hypothetical protein